MIRHCIFIAVIASAFVISFAEDESFNVEIIPINATLVYNKPAVLKCEVDGLTSYKPILWYRHGKKIQPDGVKYITDDLNDNLTITHANEDDIGEYMCGFELDNKQNFSQTIHLFAKPHVSKFETTSKNLVQSDPLVLNCNAWGHPAPVVHWLKDGLPINQDDERISVKDNGAIVNGTLRIENLDYPDRADYTCVASYDGHTANTTILVRVKDKLAALWPFLGICVEVIVLCVIIFIYEKRRAKKMAEEDTPEEAGQLTNSHDHKGKDDVRQRK